jgi:hypothetical protein
LPAKLWFLTLPSGRVKTQSFAGKGLRSFGGKGKGHIKHVKKNKYSLIPDTRTWEQVMYLRGRKQIPVCSTCHRERIHTGKYDGPSLKAFVGKKKLYDNRIVQIENFVKPGNPRSERSEIFNRKRMETAPCEAHHTKKIIKEDNQWEEDLHQHLLRWNQLHKFWKKLTFKLWKKLTSNKKKKVRRLDAGLVSPLASKSGREPTHSYCRNPTRGCGVGNTSVLSTRGHWRKTAHASPSWV